VERNYLLYLAITIVEIKYLLYLLCWLKINKLNTLTEHNVWTCLELNWKILSVQLLSCGPGSSVGKRLATGWTVRGSNPGVGEIFRTCPDRSWGPPSLLYNGYQVFTGGKKRPGRDADPSPPSSAEVQNQSRAIPILSIRAFVACKKGVTYLPVAFVIRQ
jgi:hypothetical protein